MVLTKCFWSRVTVDRFVHSAVLGMWCIKHTAFNKVFPPIIFSARSRVLGSTCELQTSLSDNCSAIGADLVHLSCAHSDSVRKRMLI